ncbi:MAG: peptide deformylase [Acidobacteriota bacterium]|nr:peptide deformylase [Acidobacteriota bacterium]
MAVRPIRIYPDPVLRVRCPTVEAFDEALGKLVDDMVDTMHAAPGIGLAANQVGEEYAIAVVDLSVGERHDDLVVLVNPEIVNQEGVDDDTEGCLSLPGITDKVRRPTSIRVRATNTQGESFELEAEGLLARAICHEIDHLSGVLFTDRLHGLRKERGRRLLKKLAQEQTAVS